MTRFKIDDVVRCINNDGYGGAGWSEGITFTINKITKVDFPMNYCYWGEGTKNDNGVFEKYLEIVNMVPDELFEM